MDTTTNVASNRLVFIPDTARVAVNLDITGNMVLTHHTNKPRSSKNLQPANMRLMTNIFDFPKLLNAFLTEIWAPSYGNKCNKTNEVGGLHQ